MITIFAWRKDLPDGIWLEADALRSRKDELRNSMPVIWINLEASTEDEEELVFKEFFCVHALTREDITRMRRKPADGPHLPKVEEFADYLFVVVNPLGSRYCDVIQGCSSQVCAEGRTFTQLSTVLTHTVLITHHLDPVLGIQELKSYLSRHANSAERGPDFLFHLILDAIVDHYAPVLDQFTLRLDSIENQLLEQPNQCHLVELLELKREVVTLRKTLVHEREVLARMVRGEFASIDPREIVYYRNVYDHLIRFSELIESTREMVTDMIQLYLGSVSNKLNEIMKVLTMISTVTLPMTLIAGIFGMNFEHMPELHWRFGYPLALLLIIVSGVAAFTLFRWKRWI